METNTKELNTKRKNNKAKSKIDDSSNSITTTLEHKLEKDPFQKIETPRHRDLLEDMRNMKKSEIPIRYEVSCLAATDEMVFMGLENQLGVLVNNNKSNKRQVRFPHSDLFREITCL